MADYAIEQILGHAPLTTTLRTTVSGVHSPWPEELFKVDSKNRVMADRAKYVRIKGERRPAKRTYYGAPSVPRALRPIEDAAVILLHFFEHFTVGLHMLQKLRAFEQYIQDEGRDFLRYQFEEQAHRIANTRIVAVGSVLRHGKIYIGEGGDLLPTSSGAAETIDFNVPATHKDQINGIISAPWNLHSTDIPLHIRNINQFSRQETGMEIKTAFYGVNIPTYFTQNDHVQAYLSRDGNLGMRDKWLSTGELPDGLFGIEKWVPAYHAYFLSDDEATVHEVWEDDLVTFIPSLQQPDKMGNWWSMFEGSFAVPKSYQIVQSPEAVLNNFDIVYGMGSFGIPVPVPPSANVHVFDTFLPALRNSLATFHVDTVF